MLSGPRNYSIYFTLSPGFCEIALICTERRVDRARKTTVASLTHPQLKDSERDHTVKTGPCTNDFLSVFSSSASLYRQVDEQSPNKDT